MPLNARSFDVKSSLNLFYARPLVALRETSALLIEQSRRRATKQCTTRIALSEDKVGQELGTERR